MFDYLTRVEWKRQRRAARLRALLYLATTLACLAAAAISGVTFTTAVFGFAGLIFLLSGTIELKAGKRYTRLLEKP